MHLQGLVLVVVLLFPKHRFAGARPRRKPTQTPQQKAPTCIVILGSLLPEGQGQKGDLMCEGLDKCILRPDD